MSKTPKKRRVSELTVDSPAALKGKRIECPGPIFHESSEKIYAGVILGTPSGKKNSVTVRFDEDGTRYWFPVEDVKRWIVNETGTPAKTPKPTRTKRKAEAEMDALTEDGAAGTPPCADGGAPPGAATGHKAAVEEEEDAEEARVDAIYQAHGWHSFRQFLIFWGFLVMGMLMGILIWLVQRPHSK